jgi:hypothetical protein
MSLVSQKDLDTAVKALKRHKGNATDAAAELGLARTTFRDRLKLAARSGVKIPKITTGKARIYEAHDKQKSDVLESYAKACKKVGRHLTWSELTTTTGYTRNQVKEHFHSFGSLMEASKGAHPEYFVEIIDDLFTPKRFKALKDQVAKHRRFVITTAVTGCEPHFGFLASLESYCKIHDAALLIIPSTDTASHPKAGLHAAFADKLILTEDIRLNRNLFVSAIRCSAKQIDPLTGLARIGQRDGSFIYGSPKQFLKLVPNSNTQLPVALMTTGAVTVPSYDPDPEMAHAFASMRTAYIANHDHALAAIVVELADEHRFHYRQLEADARGAFADLGQLYMPDGKVRPYAPEALVLGDLHAGATDQGAFAAFVDGPGSLTEVARPRTIILHDAFDGKSINHHEAKNLTMRAQLSAMNKLDLGQEVKGLADVVNLLCEYYEQVIIVKSNHDKFLDRYLAELGFHRDPQNTLIGLELAGAVIRGLDPLRHAVERHLTHPEQVRWLKIDEDYKIGGVECGAHGHVGANGSKGGLVAMENSYGQSTSGHAHTPAIRRRVKQVGTCGQLQESYNEGPSNWLHCSSLQYPNGTSQLVNSIEGSWHLVD